MSHATGPVRTRIEPPPVGIAPSSDELPPTLAFRQTTAAERLAEAVSGAMTVHESKKVWLSGEGIARVIDAFDVELMRSPGMQPWAALIDVISVVRHQGHENVARALHGLLLAAADDMNINAALLTRMLNQRTAWRRATS